MFLFQLINQRRVRRLIFLQNFALILQKYQMALKRLLIRFSFFIKISNWELIFTYSFYGQFCFDIFFSSCKQAVYCTIFNCLQPLCHIVRTQQEHKMQVTLMGKNKCRKKKSISFSRTRYCPKCSVSGHIETIRGTSPEVNMAKLF